MKKQLKLQTLLGLVVIFSMLLAAVPMGTVQAATPIDGWSTPITLSNVANRPAVVFDGTTYHMWYNVGNETTLYYTHSTSPTNFPAGIQANFPDATEVASTAITLDGGTFYMVKYSAGTIQKFSIYTSTDGINWADKGQVFDMTLLPKPEPGYEWNKIDAPSFFIDGTTIKLYFQAKLKTTSTGVLNYSIYSAAPVTGETLASIADGNADDDFTTVALALDRNTFGANDVMHPWVVKDGNTYNMWFSVNYPGKSQTIGFATSTDGASWTVVNPGVIMIANGRGEPNAIKIGNYWHLWYLDTLSKVSYIKSLPESVAVTVDKTSAQPDQPIVASIYGKSTNLYGVELHLTFPAALLSVQSIDLTGTGLAASYPSQNKYDNIAGTIDIAYTQEAPAVPVAGDNILLGKVTFKALVPTATSTATIGFSDVKFSDKDGFPTGTVVTTPASVTVNPWTGIQGQFGLQGRTDYSGIAVTLDTTPVNTPVNGLYAFPQILEGSHTLTAQKPGYLTASWTLSLLSQPYTFPYVMLLGGDATGDGNINLYDLTAIGTDFAATPNISGTTDINGDNVVNIFDLTMAGGNYNKQSDTAYAGLLP